MCSLHRSTKDTSNPKACQNSFHVHVLVLYQGVSESTKIRKGWGGGVNIKKSGENEF